MTDHETINCPSCGKPMRLRQLLPSFGRQQELRTYECVACAIVKTEKVEG